MRLPVVTALIALAIAILPASAAAERSVPRGWLGVIADGPLTSGGAMDGEWNLMAGSGAESVRTAFYWPSAQRDGGAPPALAHLDGVVLQAARRGLPVLPIVTGTPGWAASRPHDETSPPRDPELYADFLRTLVARYGPRGSLWAEHPEVAARPIRDWQIWNEPNLTRYWTPPRGQGFARSYVKLLRAAHRALRGADRGSRTILAGLPNESWIALRRLYAAGARKSFDAVALHPYTGKPRNVVRLAEYARREMRRFKDRRKPIWITELSWPAAKGKTDNTTGFETTDRGQAQRLGQGLELLARARKRLRIQRVLWYTWLSREGSPNSFDYSGLRRERGGQIVSVPALDAFRKAARRLQGCAKASGDATRCR
jgi:Glycosyl hydrolase catalytic core